GTNDVLPAQSAAWQWLLETHARVAQAHGYQLIDTPVIEYTELFERGIGTGTDVVAKEMYTFADRGGRSLTLRPEGTAGVLRAYFNPIRDQLCDVWRRHRDTNPMRILDCKWDAALTAGAPDITASLSEPSVQSFGAVLAHLDDARMPYAVNLRLVRGLDYYAHTAFELWHTSLEGAQNALGGGGRYD